MRYFRSSEQNYLSVCAQLDAAYGYPNADTKTLRTLPLANELPKDAAGLVYLAVENEFCDYELPSLLLPELLAAGAVEEISQADFIAVCRPG